MDNEGNTDNNEQSNENSVIKLIKGDYNYGFAFIFVVFISSFLFLALSFTIPVYPLGFETGTYDEYDKYTVEFVGVGTTDGVDLHIDDLNENQTDVVLSAYDEPGVVNMELNPETDLEFAEENKVIEIDGKTGMINAEYRHTLYKDFKLNSNAILFVLSPILIFLSHITVVRVVKRKLNG